MCHANPTGKSDSQNRKVGTHVGVGDDSRLIRESVHSSRPVYSTYSLALAVKAN